MKIDKKLLHSFGDNGLQIPNHTAGAIARYLFFGASPGGFLTSMFVNDWYNAVFQADQVNKQHFCDIAKWVEWTAPNECKGSHEKMGQWIRMTDNERREILVRKNLAHTVFEVLKGGEKTLEEAHD